MNKKVTVSVRTLEGDKDIEATCDDAACFLDEVKTGVDGWRGDVLSHTKRAKAARWLAESALALALHFEAKHEAER